jgi:hypothetical protein
MRAFNTPQMTSEDFRGLVGNRVRLKPLMF